MKSCQAKPYTWFRMDTREVTRIFAVEDDPLYCKLLTYIFNLNPDFEYTIFKTGKECLDALHLKPAIITLDYSLPDMSGEEILRSIKAFDPQIMVIIVSAQEEVDTAVQLLRLGAFDYISKDKEARNRLLSSLDHARKNMALIREINYLKQEVTRKYQFGQSIIGNSPAMQRVYTLIEKAARTNITVSVTGETGTGKEVVDKAIHYHSERKNSPFVAVNVTAIPRELIESELFGYEKGAFTGAVAQRIGKFEEARDGTIFLDEIGEMELSLQAKLLRVLQERELNRVGGNTPVKLHMRIIVATHRDLAEEVKKGNFREDLYYRLLGLPVPLPPLRERGSDILLLARHLLHQFCQENNLPDLLLDKSAQEKLMKYHYPGNVRELKSIIELAAVMADEPQIGADSIHFNSIQKEDAFIGEELSLRTYTFRIIRHFLKKYDNNVLLVARKLQIGKSTIYRYLKEMEEENAL